MTDPSNRVRGLKLLGIALLAGGNLTALFVAAGLKVVFLSIGALGAALLAGAAIYDTVRTFRNRERPTEPKKKRVRSELFKRSGIPTILLVTWRFVGPALIWASLLPFFVLGWFPADAIPAWSTAAVLGPSTVIAVCLAIVLLLTLRRLPAGTRGKLRLHLLGWGTLLESVGLSILATTAALALADPAALMSAGFQVEASSPAIGEDLPLVLDALLQTMRGQGTFAATIVGAVAYLLGSLVSLPGLVGSWFLIPERPREVFWFIFDVCVVGAFVAVTLLFPLQPEQAGDDLLLPSIRLGVTTVAAVRLLIVMIGPILDVVELGGFRMTVAARLMRAKRSGFLTAIGGFSILAVAVSSCMLTSVLSVMGGFRNDLKQKILGNNAHVVVDRERGTFEGWEPTINIVRDQEHVVAATPYVHGEVMITSATNLAGAILRGIDPETIGDVTELPRNLRHGRMEYLSEPDRLLRLDNAEMRRDLLDPSDPDFMVHDESFFEGVEEMLLEMDSQVERDGGEAEPDTPPTDEPRAAPLVPDGSDEQGEIDPDTARIEEEIAEFLLPEEPAPDTPMDVEGVPPGADILPGLIVGQELARTLRLHVGDQVNVVSPLGGGLTPSGYMPKTRPFRIAGIFYSGMYEFDMKMAYTTLEAGQGFLSLGDAISGIEVKVDDTDHAGEIATSINSAIDREELRVRGWQEVNRNLFGALQLEKLAMFITLGIAILVASFCIVGTLLLMVQEKAKEVGILKAMGATGEQIVAVFMIQGLMIGILGAAIGLGLGYETCFIMEHFGIHLNPEVYYIDRLPVHIDATEFGLTGITAVVVCLLATIYPAILGSRLRPVDALRYN